MTNLPIKAIEVPSWWKEIDEQEKKYGKELADLIETSAEEVKKQKEKMKDLPQSEREFMTLELSLKTRREMNEGKIKKPSDEDMDTIKHLGKILKGLNEYRWERFRLENINNDFGTAEHLFFDEEKNIIEIKEE